MKKACLKNLKLEKNIISNLSKIANGIKGGDYTNTLRENGCPGAGITSVSPYVCKITCD
ncbi:hypothetical protein [Aquimarina sp. BL5]|uniref:hypothetical protein n=1 Tax=Aquimarina sp. BL5 TaxID=1714860 RepID=UPI001314A2C3|nr:hypothetical protein [Aquimarina sp. BL5]